ncbi:hypothetical protein BKA70DRAFT_1259696 [Coprinopsis sp. MPI-PUGE-AT-0042]|nr:hypothetical protein BKA70DRAFT_1259696 [Coprinopsis sp. MPI-PUGE-AT-0042]
MLDTLLSGNEEIFSLSSPTNPLFSSTSSDSRAKVLIRPAFKRRADLTCKIILGDDSAAQTTTTAEPDEMLVASTSTISQPPNKLSPLRGTFRKLEGRIEKKRSTPPPPVVKSSPPSRASSTSSNSSVYSEDIINCPCNTRKNYDCKRCRILRLADSFCSLVEMRCEILSPPSTPTLPSPTHL